MKKSGFRILLLLALTVSLDGYAHGHREYQNLDDTTYQQERGHKGGGGEASGQIAGWLFCIANLPVVLSMLLKAGGKLSPAGSHYKAIMDKANRRQKHYLMKLHYWVNPIAAGVAILHLAVTECESTIMPELGLGLMLLIIVFGLMMTLKLSPASIRKSVFKLHTSPISFGVAVLVLMIGHSLID
jgi:hypothetical protein